MLPAVVFQAPDYRNWTTTTVRTRLWFRIANNRFGGIEVQSQTLDHCVARN